MSYKCRKTPEIFRFPVFLFWRSRRDLNPRYPFGVHTISSRARYDHFDTAPCGLFSTAWISYYNFPGLSTLDFAFLKKYS